MYQIGDRVKRGDVLMTIESSDYLAGYTEANAAYELAQIQAKQASTSAKRFKVLLEEGAVTQSQWEEADMGAQLAKGQATRAKAGLDIATSRLQGTKLKAPFNGVIVERTIEVGEMMGGPATRPPLQIVDLSTVRIQASIGETDAVSLSDNQNGTLEIPGHHEGIPRVPLSNQSGGRPHRQNRFGGGHTRQQPACPQAPSVCYVASRTQSTCHRHPASSFAQSPKPVR